MSVSIYILPAFVLIAFVLAFIKKVNVYDAFISGVNDAISLLLTIFPYICAVLIMSELFEASGLSLALTKALSPLLKPLGIPPELTKLILIKPLSGNGSLALLTEIYSTHGADSYLGKCASCIFSCSETVFYVSAIYFSQCKNKSARLAIIISLIACFLSCIFACFLCRFF
jgi:spore maturation protein B